MSTGLEVTAMATSKPNGFLARIAALFKPPPPRDYLEGIVDGDPDAPVKRKAPKKPNLNTLRIKIIIEAAKGLKTTLITCNVTMDEFERFCNNAEAVLETKGNAVVFINPCDEGGVEQARVGVPLDRLVRIERADGETLFELTRFVHVEPHDESGSSREFL
jgi:hypothetical protein